MSTKQQRPFLVYLLGPKDTGKTLFSAGLVKLAKSGRRVIWRNQEWILSIKDVPEKLVSDYGQMYLFDTNFPPFTDAGLIPRILFFELTRVSDKNKQPFILFDPPGGYALPREQADRNDPEIKTLQAAWTDSSYLSAQIFRMSLVQRIDVLVFINSSVRDPERPDPLLTEPDSYAEQAGEFLAKGFAPQPSSGKAPTPPFCCNFIVYYSASESILIPHDGLELERVIGAANASTQTRLSCYKSYVDSQYRRYVESLTESYAPKLREATGLTLDLQPFFGCPIGQNRDGRVNWHPRKPKTIADPEHWHPLFVLEPIIELMKQAQADSV